MKKEKNLEVIYIGTHDRMEKDIIPKMGYRYIPIEIYGFSKNLKKDWKNSNPFLLIKVLLTYVCGKYLRLNLQAYQTQVQ